MAEDQGDKTEAPTPRRRQEAREQGNIARSPDLTAAALLIGLVLLLKWYGPGLVGALRKVVEDMLGAESLSNVTPSDALLSLLSAILLVAGALAPLLLGAMLLAVMVNVAQVGFVLNGKKLMPNLGMLNPLRGLKRIFGGGRGPVSFLMNVAKIVLVAFVAYSAVHDRIATIISVQQLTFIQIFGLGAQIVYAIAIRIGILLFVLAILDYMYQRYKTEQELKMSKQEVKEEMRRMEGDPQIKQRRRQIAIHQHTQRLKKVVPTADVIVTNPTHFAVALKYDADNMHAPRVVAKGQDFMAHRIREIAIAHGIPILERKPLARALYKLCEVGQEIPEQFYSAVAEILAYVYELSGKIRHKQSA